MTSTTPLPTEEGARPEEETACQERERTLLRQLDMAATNKELVVDILFHLVKLYNNTLIASRCNHEFRRILRTKLLDRIPALLEARPDITEEKKSLDYRIEISAYCAHVYSTLNMQTERLAVLEDMKRVPNQPASYYARMDGNAGDAYTELGRLDEAEMRLTSSLKGFIATSTPPTFEDKEEHATVYLNLATVCSDLGKTELSNKYFEMAATIVRSFDEDDYTLSILAMRERIAVCIGDRGDHHSMAWMLEGILDKMRDHANCPPETMAITMSNLGTAHGHIGNRHRKRELLIAALAMIEKVYGPDDIHIVGILNTLGDAHGAFGDYRLQLLLQERALCIQRNLPLDSQQTALMCSTLNRLASAYIALGHTNNAAICLTKALPIATRVFGSHSKEVAVIYSQLGRAEDGTVCIECYKNALAIYDHLRSKRFEANEIGVCINLAHAYGRIRRYDDMHQIIRRALDICGTARLHDKRRDIVTKIAQIYCDNDT